MQAASLNILTKRVKMTPELCCTSKGMKADSLAQAQHLWICSVSPYTSWKIPNSCQVQGFHLSWRIEMYLKYIDCSFFFFLDQLPNIFAATGRTHNELSRAGEWKSKGPCLFLFISIDANIIFCSKLCSPTSRVAPVAPQSDHPDQTSGKKLRSDLGCFLHVWTCSAGVSTPSAPLLHPLSSDLRG